MWIFFFFASVLSCWLSDLKSKSHGFFLPMMMDNIKKKKRREAKKEGRKKWREEGRKRKHSIRKDVEKSEHSCIFGGNVKWYAH